jgi:hypothetical protein
VPSSTGATQPSSQSTPSTLTRCGFAGGRFTALDLDARIAEAVAHLEPRPRHR